MSWGTCAGIANLSWARSSLRSELLRIFSQDTYTKIPMSIILSVPAPAQEGITDLEASKTLTLLHYKYSDISVSEGDASFLIIPNTIN